MQKLLFINACVRDESRTRRLAERLLSGLGGQVSEIRLHKLSFPVTDQSFLERRSALSEKGEFTDPCFDLAREFAGADTIVIAAPYWDLSFPAALKQYFEQINVVGVTFAYSPEGIPVGLCRAKRLFYITTAGGRILSDEYGFGYVKALSEGFYHIPSVRQIKAEGLDLPEADVPGLLRRAEAEIDRLLAEA